MSEPINGIDVVLQIKKAGAYRDYLCATDITIEFDTETKSIKTVGDGTWKKYRAQSIQWNASLSGLNKLNTGDDPAAFDLLDYQINFTDIEFRMIFQDSDGNLKVAFGTAVVQKSSFNGPSEGFSTSNFTLQGNGPITITDALTACAITATDVTVDLTSLPFFITYSFTVTGGTPLRYEYSIDGGGRIAAFSSPVTASSPGSGAHTIEVFPICENGFDGTPFTKSFTI